jgi:hypothetical protein
MAARSGNDADGRRTTPSRGGVLLRVLTLVAFAAGFWCLTGTAIALAGEHTALQNTALQDTALQNTALQNTALQNTALQNTALQDTALQDTAVRNGLLRQPARGPELRVGPVRIPSEGAAAGAPTPSVRREVRSEADLVSRVADALFWSARHRGVPASLAPRPAVPGAANPVPRASRGGPPRAGLLPAGAGSVPGRSAGASPRIVARPVPVSSPGSGAITPGPPESSGPARATDLAAVPREGPTATVNPDREPAAAGDKTPGLCALAHGGSPPAAPLCRSGVVRRTVPTHCLHGSEPPVSPD